MTKQTLAKCLFGAVTLLMVLIVALCTCRLAQAEEEPVVEVGAWDLMGRAISYCGGVGYHTSMMSKFDEYGAKLRITRPDGTTVDFYDKTDKRDCEIVFINREDIYAITLVFSFETKEAYDTWSDIAYVVADNFCKAARRTPIYGFVNIEDFKGVTIFRNCEEDKTVARRENDSG